MRISRRGKALVGAVVLWACAAQPAAAADTRSCGWVLVGSSSQVNLLFPDTAASYWQGHVPIPPGGHVELRGQFPHARYTSVTVYTGQSQSIDGLHDTQIVPDPGSTNPFLPGADRTATQRSYTLRIVYGQVPAGGRAPNTIYTTDADGSKSGTPLSKFSLRIYEGDRGTGITGGVPLPTMTIVTALGLRIPVPQCPDVNLPDLGITSLLAGTSPPAALPLDIPIGGGEDPPVWHKFTSTLGSLLTNAGGGDSALAELAEDLVGSGGFGDNADNKYVSTAFSAAFGKVLAFRAKAPTFPATGDGQPTMGTGQLRYWSFCTNAQTTQVYACTADDQTPLDADGDYTVVLSSAADRPANATRACGVAWLPTGPLSKSIVILRNMLPAPSFAEAIHNAEPGTEAATMGAYYPRGTYYATPADFEATGCAD
jgi:hypothetical protein